MLMTWAILVKLITALIQSCHHSRFLETSFYFIHLSSLHKFVILCTPRFREPNPQVQWTWPLHRLQIWLASLLAWPTSPISPLPTSDVICNRSFVLLLLPPRPAVKRNGMLVHLPDVMRMLPQHGVIVRKLRIR